MSRLHACLAECYTCNGRLPLERALAILDTLESESEHVPDISAPMHQETARAFLLSMAVARVVTDSLIEAGLDASRLSNVTWDRKERSYRLRSFSKKRRVSQTFSERAHGSRELALQAALAARESLVAEGVLAAGTRPTNRTQAQCLQWRPDRLEWFYRIRRRRHGRQELVATGSVQATDASKTAKARAREECLRQCEASVASVLEEA